MKRIFVFATLLCASFCDADSVTMVPVQQSWNVIRPDSTISIDNQNNSAAHTANTSNPITFSTQHKSYRHHTAAPYHDPQTMSTEQLARYFKERGYTDEQILERKDLFKSAAFVAFAKQLPKYADYVQKYYNEFRKFNWYSKCIGWIFSFYTPGFQKTFTRLHAECEEEKYAQEKRKHTQEQLVKKITAYCTSLDTIATNDVESIAVPYHHRQQRKSAINAIKMNGTTRSTQWYTATSDILTFGEHYGITQSDITTIHGTVYEQQLHTEFLEQLATTFTLSTYQNITVQNPLITALGHSISIGMKANHSQRHDIATIWANCGWKLLEIICGAGEGLLLCAENVAHCIQYPKETVTEFVYSLGHLAGYCMRTIGTVAHWYALMEHGDGLLMAQEMDEVANKISICSSICAEALSNMSARDLAKNITHIVADTVITHQAITFGCHFCSELKSIVFECIKNIQREETLVEIALQGAEEFGDTGKISLFMEEAEIKSIQHALPPSIPIEELTLESALNKWQQSEKLKQLEQRCAELSDTISDIRLGLYGNRPNLSGEEFLKLEKMALQKYETIRNSIDDIRFC